MNCYNKYCINKKKKEKKNCYEKIAKHHLFSIFSFKKKITQIAKYFPSIFNILWGYKRLKKKVLL